MNKLQALNTLEVEDFSCCDGELEYVLTETTAATIKVLLDAGFNAGEIDEAMEAEKTHIDLSVLAFQYANAGWWDVKGGFAVEAGEEDAE